MNYLWPTLVIAIKLRLKGHILLDAGKNGIPEPEQSELERITEATFLQNVTRSSVQESSIREFVWTNALV
jgi:hypothetical protein